MLLSPNVLKSRDLNFSLKDAKNSFDDNSSGDSDSADFGADLGAYLDLEELILLILILIKNKF